MIYLDPALTNRASQLRVIKALAERSSELAALGDIEVVRAVSAPRRVLEPTREPEAIRRAILSLAAPTTGRATLEGRVSRLGSTLSR